VQITSSGALFCNPADRKRDATGNPLVSTGGHCGIPASRKRVANGRPRPALWSQPVLLREGNLALEQQEHRVRH
jgi:hypothetical protein